MPYPTTTDYIFEEGLDPSAVFTSPEATALLSFLRLAIPNDYRGMVIVSTTTPATSGQPSGYPTDWYEWQQRCIWFDPSNGNLFGYVTGLGWQPITPAAGSIGTDELANAAVTAAKLAPNTALYLLRTNAAGTAVEWVALSSVLSNGSIALSSLSPTGASSTLGFLRSNGTTNYWGALTAFDINLAIPTGGLGVNKLNQGAARNVLRMRTDAAYAEWIAPTAIFDANEIPITQLSPGSGNANKAAVVNALGTGFEYRALPAAPTVTVRTSTAAAVPGVGATLVYAHTLAAVPTLFEAYFVCVTPNNNYVAGDYIHYTSVTTGGGNDERPAFGLTADATNLTLVQANIAPTQRNFLNKTTGVSATFTDAEWNVVFKATLLA